MSHNRNWSQEIVNIENSISSSKKTIALFEATIKEAIEKNKLSELKIIEWEKKFHELNDEFKKVNGIDFFQAQDYVDNSINPSYEFNLEAYTTLKLLLDEISGERFFIYQREKTINKNTKLISDISSWVETQKAKLKKYEN